MLKSGGDKSKIFIMGPSFGVSIWNYSSLLSHFIRNYVRMQDKHVISVRYFLQDYLYTNYRRLRYDKFIKSGVVDDEYCFSLSTLWYDNLADRTTNRYRGIFTKACATTFKNFEGGFFYIPSKNVEREFEEYHKYKEEYKDLLIYKRISMATYLKKIKKSVLVFNTQSVCGCLGWKLPEFLAMGKCIISTPLDKEMPGEFLPGKHYFLVSNMDEIAIAIQYLKEHREVRERLEQNSKAYFDQYLSPTAVISRLIAAL